MPSRSYSAQSVYRYGFNGSEKDNEISGEGNSYTTEFRQYDPRLGRWLSPDPLMSRFPSWSPYVYAFDNPIWFNDPNGDAPPTVEEIFAAGKKSTTFIKLLNAVGVTEKNYKNKIVINSKTQIPYTDTKTGKINLPNVATANLGVEWLTHESSNKLKLSEFQKNQKELRSGTIKTVDEYADKMLTSELTSLANRIKVNAEAGIPGTDAGEQSFIDEYSKSGKNDKGLMRELSKIKDQIVIPIYDKDGKQTSSMKAVDYYKQQGEKILKEKSDAEKKKNESKKTKEKNG